MITATLLLSLLSNAAVAFKLINNKGWASSGQLLTGWEVGLGALLLVSFLCQRLPVHFLCYYLAPVMGLRHLRTQLPGVQLVNSQLKVSTGAVLRLVLVVLYLETIVLAFFDRRWLSLGVLLTAGLTSSGGSWMQVILVLAAGVFSWLPPIDGR